MPFVQKFVNEGSERKLRVTSADCLLLLQQWRTVTLVDIALIALYSMDRKTNVSSISLLRQYYVGLCADTPLAEKAGQIHKNRQTIPLCLERNNGVLLMKQQQLYEMQKWLHFARTLVYIRPTRLFLLHC